MEEENLLHKLVKQSNFIENLYTDMRLVDPLYKKTVCMDGEINGNSFMNSEHCYSLWGRQTACDNCISMRALTQKKPVVKIEYKNPNLFLLTAVPVEHEGSWYAVELFRDITREGIIDIEGQEIDVIEKEVAKRNSLVVKDALTRIYNEKYIFEKLPSDMARAKEQNRNTTLFLISIKNIKEINHRHGYKKGDEIIRKFSNTVKSYRAGEEDWASRYVGTEFLLVLFDTDEEQAYRLCRRMNNKLIKLELSLEQTVPKLDFSIGYQELCDAITKPDEWIKAAGNNLYNDQTGEQDQNAQTSANDILPRYLLTQREREVALLLLSGHSNIEIANSLFVGVSTVKKHITGIFEKSGVKTRAEFISKIRMQQ